MRLSCSVLLGLFLGLTHNIYASNNYQGTLAFEKDNIILKTDNADYSINTSDKLLLGRIKSHVRDNYYFSFKGVEHGNELIIKDTPTIIGDIQSITGTLEYNLVSGYSIDNVPAKFGRTKPIYDVPFDEESMKSYLGKNIKAQGHYDDNNAFVINSILENNLFVAGETELTPENQEHNAFNKNPYKYILKEMPKNNNSQNGKAFRGIVHQDKNYNVAPGEKVLIITLSGRQGDFVGAAGGHFAFGSGTVLDDENLSIDGQIHNFYFTGEKEVLAGNTKLNNYYGHIIQGQQNYRPTYTLLLYGVDANDLKKAKEAVETDLEKVRTVPGLEISQYYNCVTSSLDALEGIGLSPIIKRNNQEEGHKQLMKLALKHPSKFLDIAYVLTTFKERFIPRNAFEGFLKVLKNGDKRKRLGIKRIDYVFIPQTPSARAVGGISYNDFFEGMKVIKNKDKKLTQAEIDNVLLTID